jgi:predicted Zn-dependent protease
MVKAILLALFTVTLTGCWATTGALTGGMCTGIMSINVPGQTVAPRDRAMNIGIGIGIGFVAGAVIDLLVGAEQAEQAEQAEAEREQQRGMDARIAAREQAEEDATRLAAQQVLIAHREALRARRVRVAIYVGADPEIIYAVSEAANRWNQAIGHTVLVPYLINDLNHADAKDITVTDMLIGNHYTDVGETVTGGEVVIGTAAPRSGELLDVTIQQGLEGEMLRTTAVHELGHALGLGHEADRNSVMFRSVNTYSPALRVQQDISLQSVELLQAKFGK